MTTVLTRLVARGLLAPVLMVAVAVLVKGYVGVGDGFAAGIIASLGVLLQYLAFGRDQVVDALPVRHAPTVAIAGLSIAVAILVIPAIAGGAPLEHFPGRGEDVTYVGTLELITPLAFDLALFLLVVGAVVTIIDALASPAREGEEKPA